MKIIKLISTVVLMVIFIKSLSGQATYHPFPHSNAVWNVLEFYYTDYAHSDSMQKNTFHFGIFGDTIIGTHYYDKIFYNNGLTDSTIHISSPNTIYFGGLRQDELSKKIFFLFKDSINEKLIYDFNMNIGDTVTIQSYWGNHVLRCMDIDTILIGNQYRNRYFMWSSFTMVGDVWIEGIGSVKGFLFSYNYNILANPRNELLCFTSNDTLLYHMDGSITEYPISNISLYTGCYYQGNYITSTNCYNESISKVILVMPNPIINLSILRDINGNSLAGSCLDIYNIYGGLVKEIRIIEGNVLQLNRVEFHSGLYLYKITNFNNTYTGKFIVE